MKKFAIILAGGKGTNMLSMEENSSKMCFPILDKPLINYVLDALKPLNFDEIFTVVGFGGEHVKKLVEKDSTVVWQNELLGTGHAVKQVKKYIENIEGETLIVHGDTALISTETIEDILKIHKRARNTLTIVSAILPSAKHYGRIIREAKSNRLLEIKEEADCNSDELSINEANTGVCVVDNQTLCKYLDLLTQNNKRNLFYLSELVKLLKNDNYKIGAYVASDMVEMFGINNRQDLAYGTKIIRKRINTKLMLEGVTIEDPDTAFISPSVQIEADTIIYPNTIIKGNTSIGKRNIIGPNTVIDNSKIGDGNIIENSHVHDSEIGNQNKCGLYNIINKTNMGNNCKLDNYLELNGVIIKDNEILKK